MKQNFPEALARVLVHEGGYVNHPKDPGGATNKGITHRVYDAWRRAQGLAPRDVREITDDEVAAIYRAQYWAAIRGDDLPAGLDYAVFDFAVNSGPSRAAKFLQHILGVSEDGHIGEITLAAIRGKSVPQLILALCEARLAWLKRLKTWPTFGRGWERRVREVEAVALRMAGKTDRAEPVATPAPGKSGETPRATATLMDVARDPAAMTAGASAIGSLTALSQGNGPVQWAVAVALVLAALVAVWWLVRGRE